MRRGPIIEIRRFTVPSRVTTEERFVSVSPQVLLRGEEEGGGGGSITFPPWCTSLTHLGRVMAARIRPDGSHISTSFVAASMRGERRAGARARCHHSPGTIMVADIYVYTKASVLYAPRYELFMGYIARFLPPTRVLTPLLPHLLLPFPPPRFTFSFLVLSLFFFSLCFFVFDPASVFPPT